MSGLIPFAEALRLFCARHDINADDVRVEVVLKTHRDAAVFARGVKLDTRLCDIDPGQYTGRLDREITLMGINIRYRTDWKDVL